MGRFGCTVLLMLTGFCAARGEGVDSVGRSLLGVPVVFYGQETSWGFGASGGYYFGSPSGPTSSVMGMAVGTLRRQARVAVSPRVYVRGGSGLLSGRFVASHYPDRVFGLGPRSSDVAEGYTLRSVLAHVEWQQRVLADGLMVGIQARGAAFGYAQVVDGGLVDSLANMQLGCRSVGLGLLVLFDRRDNRFWPTNGEFVKVSAMRYGRLVGSSFGATRIGVDARYFVGMQRGGVVWAGQLLVDAVVGQLPFQDLPMLGGADVLRGYYSGRYRDQAMLCLQTELRFNIYKRLRGVTFVSAGGVAPSLFEVSVLKWVGGAGLRLRANDAGVHLRADVAINAAGRFGFYFTAAEAF